MPSGTLCTRIPDEDWSSPLERVRRYEVPDDTQVVRCDAYDGDVLTVPDGMALPG